MEESEQEDELSTDELLSYENEILDAIEKSKMQEEEKRGLMTYNDNCDSVNANVDTSDFILAKLQQRF